MPDIIIFQFYSDTNQNNAFDELSGMALDGYAMVGMTIEVDKSDMAAMGDSIRDIVISNGGAEVE